MKKKGKKTKTDRREGVAQVIVKVCELILVLKKRHIFANIAKTTGITSEIIHYKRFQIIKNQVFIQKITFNPVYPGVFLSDYAPEEGL